MSDTTASPPWFDLAGFRWCSDGTVLVREDCPLPSSQFDGGDPPYEWHDPFDPAVTPARQADYFRGVQRMIDGACITERPVPVGHKCASRMLPILAAGTEWRAVAADREDCYPVAVYRGADLIAVVGCVRNERRRGVVAFDGREWREVPDAR